MGLAAPAPLVPQRAPEGLCPGAPGWLRSGACVCVCVCELYSGKLPRGPTLVSLGETGDSGSTPPSWRPLPQWARGGCPVGCPTSSSLHPEGWHLLSHSADEELRPRDPEMGVIPTLTDSGPHPDQDTLAPGSSVKPLSPSLGCRAGEAHFPSADSFPWGPAF